MAAKRPSKGNGNETEVTLLDIHRAMRSGFAELNGRNDQLAEFVDGLTKGVDALTRRVEEIAEQLSDLQATTAFGFDHMTAAVANQTARVDTLTVEVRVKLARYDERIRKIEAKK